MWIWLYIQLYILNVFWIYTYGHLKMIILIFFSVHMPKDMLKYIHMCWRAPKKYICSIFVLIISRRIHCSKTQFDLARCPFWNDHYDHHYKKTARLTLPYQGTFPTMDWSTRTPEIIEIYIIFSMWRIQIIHICVRVIKEWNKCYILQPN